MSEPANGVRPLVYGSVCSGIEAATVAWHPMGWACAFAAEIAPFPRAVLQHRWPEIPLHDDFTTIQAGDYRPIDLLVGGTPCQSFSVAGLRGGLDDERGNLALEYLRLADRLRPRWLVWENVPGVLSSSGGRDFGAILGGMVELGYGFAYRVLDAQFFGVAQRRRRVFVVGHLGDWRRAAAVLSERQGLSGHPAPRRQTGKGAAGRVAHSLRAGGHDASEDGTGRGVPLVAGTLSANGKASGSATPQDAESGMLIAFGSKDHGADAMFDLSPTLRAGGHAGGPANAGVMPAIAFGLRGRAGGAMPTARGGQVGALRAPSGGSAQDYVAFDTTQMTSNANRSSPKPGNPCHPLAAGAHPPAIAGSAVRRLTPRECERLQGFPDDYTAIPYGKGVRPEKIDADWVKYQARGNPRGLTRDEVAGLAADGPRYKALGNSMAVPVMAWIGRRIAAVEAMGLNGAAA